MPPRRCARLTMPGKALLDDPELVRVIPMSTTRSIRGKQNFNLGFASKLDFAHFRECARPFWRSCVGPEDRFIGDEPEGVVERERDAAERCGIGPSIAMRPV